MTFECVIGEGFDPLSTWYATAVSTIWMAMSCLGLFSRVAEEEHCLRFQHLRSLPMQLVLYRHCRHRLREVQSCSLVSGKEFGCLGSSVTLEWMAELVSDARAVSLLIEASKTRRPVFGNACRSCCWSDCLNVSTQRSCKLGLLLRES